jgi:hypothetical protein
LLNIGTVNTSGAVHMTSVRAICGSDTIRARPGKARRPSPSHASTIMNTPANAMASDTVVIRVNSPNSGSPGTGLYTGAAPAPSDPTASNNAPTVPNRRMTSS